MNSAFEMELPFAKIFWGALRELQSPAASFHALKPFIPRLISLSTTPSSGDNLTGLPLNTT